MQASHRLAGLAFVALVVSGLIVLSFAGVKSDQPVEVLRVVHTFDPCLACAVHMVRPDDRARGVKVLVPPGIA